MNSEPTRNTVASLLAEAGLAHDDELGGALESLRALCPPEAPEPTGALAELLAGGNSLGGVRSIASTRSASLAADEALGKLGAPADSVVVRFVARKRHRGAMIGAVVVAGVGLGASGVAAVGGVDYGPGTPQGEAGSVSAPLESGAKSHSTAGAPAVPQAGGGAVAEVGWSGPISAVLSHGVEPPRGDSAHAHEVDFQEPALEARAKDAVESAVDAVPAREVPSFGGSGRHVATVERQVVLEEPHVDTISMSASFVRPLANPLGQDSAKTARPSASRGRHR